MANNEYTNDYTLSHEDVVKAVILHQNIREGFWKLNVNFNVAASHGPHGPDPHLAVSIRSIGITKASADDPLAVDAALVNSLVAPRIERTIGIATADNGSGSVGTQFCRDVYRNIAILSPVRSRLRVS